MSASGSLDGPLLRLRLEQLATLGHKFPFTLGRPLALDVDHRNIVQQARPGGHGERGPSSIVRVAHEARAYELLPEYLRRKRGRLPREIATDQVDELLECVFRPLTRVKELRRDLLNRTSPEAHPYDTLFYVCRAAG